MFRISLDHQLIILAIVFGIRNGSVWFYCRMNHPLLGEGSTYLVVIGHGERKCHVHWDERHMIIQCAPLSPRHVASFHSRNIAQLVSRMREITTHGFLGWKKIHYTSDNDNSDHGSIENYHILSLLIPQLTSCYTKLQPPLSRCPMLVLRLPWAGRTLCGTAIYRCLIEPNLIQLISNDQSCVLSKHLPIHPSIHPSC